MYRRSRMPADRATTDREQHHEVESSARDAQRTEGRPSGRSCCSNPIFQCRSRVLMPVQAPAIAPAAALAIAPAATLAAAPSPGPSTPAAEDDTEFSDATGKICLLCARQFKTPEQTRRHMQESALHKVRPAGAISAPC
jgi:hypothetical protein